MALHDGIDMGTVRDVYGDAVLGEYRTVGVRGGGDGVAQADGRWKSGECWAGFAVSRGVGERAEGGGGYWAGG